MGLLSALGKIGGLVGAVGAAPFTGGLSLASIPAIAGAVGSVAGMAAGGKSDQRMQEGALAAQGNRNAVDLYGTQQNAELQRGQLDLQRKQFEDQARGLRGRQSTIADLLGSLQDINISVPGIQTASVTGGLRPSALGPGAREALAGLHQSALTKLLAGDTFSGGEMVAPPVMAGMPKAGGLEKTLDMLGLLGSLGGAATGESLADLMKPKYTPSAGGGMVNPELIKNVRF